MARVIEPHGDMLVDLHLLPVAAGTEQFHQSLYVLHGVSRLHRRTTGTLFFPGLPLRILLLNVGAVPEHNIRQHAGCSRGIHRAPESVFIQQRQISGMVNVGMGQQHKVNIPRLHRNFHIFIQVLALLHTAVHQTFDAAHLNERTAAGHFMGCADKRQFHGITLRKLPRISIPPEWNSALPGQRMCCNPWTRPHHRRWCAGPQREPD